MAFLHECTTAMHGIKYTSVYPYSLHFFCKFKWPILETGKENNS